MYKVAIRTTPRFEIIIPTVLSGRYLYGWKNSLVKVKIFR